MIKLTNATTDHEIITLWLSDKTHLTVKSYDRQIQQFLNFVGKDLTSVMYEDFMQYKGFMKMKGYKPSTQRTKLTAVKSLFSFCTKLGYLSANVAVIVDNVAVKDEVRRKALPQDTISLLLNNAKTERDKLIIKTLYLLGLRVSELVNIQWSDFTICNGKIELKVIGKGDKERYVLVPNDLFNSLIAQKSHDNYVFISYQNDKLSRQSINKMLSNLTKKLDINSINPHAFRHSHATHSLANGCDISLLMQSLGHSDLRITQQYLSQRDGEGSSQYLNI
ncbi:tyrosine-type recombinase/integrase [Geminocystis sp. NIES-3709]|uniref:tyrosine-type recombinase/integrase n=1 Tax=Geminocystis sp. NIES-3709 TaxID=1617448 RepID=UPI0005FC9317|nr:tyrosine-type recombinase/integrase [Geminocystis sp. NIES-3709]BAQ67117.1 phage integrase [Geminocystis sp. NIES-3709]